MTVFMLALFGRERRPRVVPDEDWKWAKAWANRWWVVEAPSPLEARRLIAIYEEKRLVNLSQPLDSMAYGIRDCGRNGSGNPQRGSAPSRRRRELERGPRTPDPRPAA